MSGGRFALALVGGVVVIVVCVIVLNFFDPPAQSVRATSAALTIAEQQALAPTWMDVKRGLIASAGMGGSVLIVAICLGLSFLVLREPLLLRHHKGIFPAFFSILGLRASNPPGNQEAHAEYARVAGVQRPLGRPVLPRPEAQLALPAPDDLTVELLAEDVLAPDMRLYNNKMIIAQSRFGKTTTGWAFIRRARAALPDCEFLVFSILASKWPGMCSASTPAEMLAAMQAVEKEIDRRDKYLKRLKVTDVHESNALPALIIVFDEVETSLEVLSGADRTEFKRLVTRLVNTGGNVNMGLVSLSQTGERSIMPKSMLNNTDLLMGRVGPYVPATFGIQDPKLVKQLTTCENGHYYSYRHQTWVQMPIVKPPTGVRMSQIYTPVLQLAADGEADNVDGIDLPSTPTDQELVEANGTVRDALLALGYSKTEAQQAIEDLPDDIRDTEERIMQALASFSTTIYAEQPTTVVTTTIADNQPQGGVYQAVVPVVQPQPLTTVVRGPYGIPKISTRRPPTAEEAQMMREAKQSGASMTRICVVAWGYKDGSDEEPVWAWMKDALEGRL